ncbi:GerAB/ArcD/ProY family transporter [Paucisalibacillus globulus]|uniref:GerAB/ArcD/ProY family transporter n=1 Tax=Paucisalibacillus globulus TaxID=351095 RepID=UPI00040F0F0F|nr:endospore germination permease [Paucisalibacillus globulus]
MKFFEYGNEKIGGKEILIAIPSMLIGVGVLSLPRNISSNMIGSDGWIVLLLTGVISMLMVWLMARLAASFPNQHFLSYASIIVSKPIAIVLTFLFAISFITFAAYDIRVLGHISQQYLFDHTPVEIVTVSFLLVVVYAVAGSRAALFRLNIIFFPIITIILLLVLLINIKWMDWTNMLPVFQTDFNGYIKGMHTSLLSYMGFSIVLFYIAIVERPERAPKLVMIGMTIPIVFYVMVYFACILVFGYTATSNLLFPTIDLAKRIEIPGGIFERVESFFFVVWTMGVFNTTAMAFDVAVLALHSIFKRIKKMQLILILSPLIYYLALLPRDTSQIVMFGEFIGSYLVSFTFLTTMLLIIVAKIRRVKHNDKTTI